MINDNTGTDNPIRQRMAEEETIQHKVDIDGTRWTKVYFGGGLHYKNWLSQCIELKGIENVETEVIDAAGFRCYEQSGEKMYRIWVKDTSIENKAKEND